MSRRASMQATTATCLAGGQRLKELVDTPFGWRCRRCVVVLWYRRADAGLLPLRFANARMLARNMVQRGGGGV
jgi:hypothetical protein